MGDAVVLDDEFDFESEALLARAHILSDRLAVVARSQFWVYTALVYGVAILLAILTFIFLITFFPTSFYIRVRYLDNMQDYGLIFIVFGAYLISVLGRMLYQSDLDRYSLRLARTRLEQAIYRAENAPEVS